MSRIGKQPITLPDNVEIDVKDASVAVRGPKGAINVAIGKSVTVAKQDKTIMVRVQNPEDHRERAQWGTVHRLIENAIVGVANGFTKRLIISGIGFRAHTKGSTLVLEVGFTHPIEFTPPEGVAIAVEGTNTITVFGIDKQLVGSAAARIRAVKKPEPYKGKGIAYEGEIIKRKAGKQAAGAIK